MARKEKKEKRWKLGDLWRFLKNCFVAIVKGEFIMRLKVEKYFAQIAYTFFLFAMMILFSMLVEGTFTKVETNKKTIKELSVLCTQKEYELIVLNRRSTVSALLEEQGSLVAEPEEPATTLN